CVGETDTAARCPHRLEHVHGTHDVHQRATWRIRRAKRKLQPGQMNDMSYPAISDQVRHVAGPGNVQHGEIGFRFLAAGYEPQPAQVAVHIACGHRHAVVEKQPHRPSAYAPRRARDEEALTHSWPPVPDAPRCRSRTDSASSRSSSKIANTSTQEPRAWVPFPRHGRPLPARPASIVECSA